MLTHDTLVSHDEPEITDSAYDDPEATVIGHITVGKEEQDVGSGTLVRGSPAEELRAVVD